MDGLSGFELYERLIAMDPVLKVCFVTGYYISELDEFKRKHKQASTRLFCKKASQCQHPFGYNQAIIGIITYAHRVKRLYHAGHSNGRMISSFATLAFIMGSIAIAGIIWASVTHPIMYANPAIIFGFLGCILAINPSEKAKARQPFLRIRNLADEDR